MKSVKTAQFNKLFSDLPLEIQSKAKRNYSFWKRNNNHPGLHFKLINSALAVYSVRVSLYYRALAVKKDDTMIWFWIGSHEDYNKIVQQM